MSELIETLTPTTECTLFAGGTYPTLRKSVVLNPGKGIVKRGAILYKDATNKMYKIAASTNLTASNIVCVCEETVDTGTDTTATGTIVNAIFRGVLIEGDLILSGASALTDANKAVLRQMGIDTVNEIEVDGTTAQVEGKEPASET